MHPRTAPGPEMVVFKVRRWRALASALVAVALLAAFALTSPRGRPGSAPTDTEDYDHLPENEEFREGDFDYGLTEPDLGLVSRMFGQDPGNDSHLWIRTRDLFLTSLEGVPVAVEGVFFSEELETRTPQGPDDREAWAAIKRLRSLKVQHLEPATWNRCGRPKNQFVVFEDGTKACARYRAPHQYLVQGEVLSFYLSRLLGIQNVPVVSLAEVTPGSGGILSNVQDDIIRAKWEVNTTVAITPWIDELERAKMPPILRSALAKKTTLTASALLHLPEEGLRQLLQWSDIILFDYITGNYDRVASMQDAAEREKKPSLMRETVHNLFRAKSDGCLWLIDNESGLLDGYSLLYGAAGKDGQFLSFHTQMLQTMCLFRKQTARRIRWLHRSKRAGSVLMQLVKQLEPLFPLVHNEDEISERLQQRISEVNAHIDLCMSRFS